MGKRINIKTPHLGIDDKVDVIEVLVSPGDEVSVEQSLISLESEKASMEIPSTHAGKVVEVLVKVGDKIGNFDPIIVLEATGDAASATEADSADADAGKPQPSKGDEAPAAAARPASAEGAKAQAPGSHDYDVVVLGSGPGGYTAAFRCADLGLKVCLIERHSVIGGVCLNVGCIPSKALLHTADVMNETMRATEMGLEFSDMKVDLDKLRQWKSGITTRLNQGLAALAKKRKVDIATGRATFISDHAVSLASDDGAKEISFASAVIACGSSPIIPGSLRIEHRALIDSTGALELRKLPAKMLIVGGGIIGLEMATVYRALGSQVNVVEMSDQLIPEADADVVQVLAKYLQSTGIKLELSTSVKSLKAHGEQLAATFSDGEGEDVYDAVLVATGRAPNGRNIGAEAAGLAVDEHGFIRSDAQMRTNVAHIYSIGDVRGQPMLAHKATHEAKVAAEVIAGASDAIFDARCIPSVAYTDPELAWVGLSEKQARQNGIGYEKAVFPFAASGRALSIGRSEGMTKLLFSKDSRQLLLGAAIVGRGAGELIAESALAIEMGANASDLAMTIHPHPTLSETSNFAAEIAEGTITDLYIPRS